jgi:hypothetical protein
VKRIQRDFASFLSSRLGTQFFAALLLGARSACRVDCSADLRRRSGSFADGSFPSRSLGTRGQRRKKWQSTDWLPFWRFLGWSPKKSACLLRPLGPLPARLAPHPRPLSRKGRREKDLEESARTHESIPWSRRSVLVRLFLGGPKKSPPFLAPQKSQKSPPVGGAIGLVVRPAAALRYCARRRHARVVDRRPRSRRPRLGRLRSASRGRSCALAAGCSGW